MPVPLLVIPAAKLGYEAVSFGVTWIPRLLFARSIYIGVTNFFSPGIATCSPFELDANHAVFGVTPGRPFTRCPSAEFKPKSKDDKKTGIPVYGNNIVIGNVKRSLDKAGEYFFCDNNRIIFAKPGQPYCEIYLDESEVNAISSVLEGALSQDDQKAVTDLFKNKQFQCSSFIRLKDRPDVKETTIKRGYTTIKVCPSIIITDQGTQDLSDNKGRYFIFSDKILFLKQGEPRYEISLDQLETSFFGGGDRKIIEDEIKRIKIGGKADFGVKAQEILAKTFKKVVDNHQKEAMKVFTQRLPSNYRKHYTTLQDKIQANKKKGVVDNIVGGFVDFKDKLFSDDTPLDQFLQYKRDLELFSSNATKVKEEVNGKLEEYRDFDLGKNEIEKGGEIRLEKYIELLKGQNKKVKTLIAQSNNPRVRAKETFKGSDGHPLSSKSISAQITAMFPEISSFTKLRFFLFAKERLNAYNEFRVSLKKDVPELVESTFKYEIELHESLKNNEEELDKEIQAAEAKLEKVKENRNKIEEKEKAIVKKTDTIENRLGEIEKKACELQGGVEKLPSLDKITDDISRIAKKNGIAEPPAKPLLEKIQTLEIRKQKLQKNIEKVKKESDHYVSERSKEGGQLGIPQKQLANINKDISNPIAVIARLEAARDTLQNIRAKTEEEEKVLQGVNRALNALEATTSLDDSYAILINEAIANFRKVGITVITGVVGAAATALDVGAEVAGGVAQAQFHMQDNISPDSLHRGATRLQEVETDEKEVSKHEAIVNDKDAEIIQMQEELKSLRTGICELQTESVKYVRSTLLSVVLEKIQRNMQVCGEALVDASQESGKNRFVRLDNLIAVAKEIHSTVHSVLDSSAVVQQAAVAKSIQEKLDEIKRVGILQAQQESGQQGSALEHEDGDSEAVKEIKNKLGELSTEIESTLKEASNLVFNLQQSAEAVVAEFSGANEYDTDVARVFAVVEKLEVLENTISKTTIAIEKATQKARVAQGKANIIEKAIVLQKQLDELKNQDKGQHEEFSRLNGQKDALDKKAKEIEKKTNEAQSHIKELESKKRAAFKSLTAEKNRLRKKEEEVKAISSSDNKGEYESAQENLEASMANLSALIGAVQPFELDKIGGKVDKIHDEVSPVPALVTMVLPQVAMDSIIGAASSLDESDNALKNKFAKLESYSGAVEKEQTKLKDNAKKLAEAKSTLEEAERKIPELEKFSENYARTGVTLALETLQLRMERHRLVLAEANEVSSANSFFDKIKLEKHAVSEDVLNQKMVNDPALKTEIQAMDLESSSPSTAVDKSVINMNVSLAIESATDVLARVFNVDKQRIYVLVEVVSSSIAKLDDLQAELQQQFKELNDLVLGTPDYDAKMVEIRNLVQSIEAVSDLIEQSTNELKKAIETARGHQEKAEEIKNSVAKTVEDAKTQEKEAREAALAPGTVLGMVKDISEFTLQYWPKGLVLKGGIIPSKEEAVENQLDFSNGLKEIYGDPNDPATSQVIDNEAEVARKKKELCDIEAKLASQFVEKYKEDLDKCLDESLTLQYHSENLAKLRDELRVACAILSANTLSEDLSYGMLIEKLQAKAVRLKASKSELYQDVVFALNQLNDRDAKESYDAVLRKYNLYQDQETGSECPSDETDEKDSPAEKLKHIVEAMEAIAAFEQSIDEAKAIIVVEDSSARITEARRFSDALEWVKIRLEDAKLKLAKAGIEYELGFVEKTALNIKNGAEWVADTVTSVLPSSAETLSKEEAHSLANPAQSLKKESIDAINKVLAVLTKDLEKLKEFEKELSNIMAQPDTSKAMHEIEAINAAADETSASYKDQYSFIKAAIVIRKAYELLQLKEELRALEAKKLAPSGNSPQDRRALEQLNNQIADKKKQMVSLETIRSELVRLKKEADDCEFNPQKGLRVGEQPGLLVEVDGKRLYNQDFLDLLGELEYNELSERKASQPQAEAHIARILDKVLDEHARPKMRKILGTRVEKDLLINRLKIFDLLKSIQDYNSDPLREIKGNIKQTILGGISKLKQVEIELQAKLTPEGKSTPIGLTPEYFEKLKAQICSTTGYEEGKSPYVDWIASLDEMIASYNAKEKEIFKSEIRRKRKQILGVLTWEGEDELSNKISRTTVLLPEPLGMDFLEKLKKEFANRVPKESDAVEGADQKPYKTGLTSVEKMLAGCTESIEPEKKAELGRFLKMVEKPIGNARISFSFEILPNSAAVAEKKSSSSSNVTIFAAPMAGHDKYTHCFRILDGGLHGTAVIGINEQTYQLIVAANEKQQVGKQQAPTPAVEAEPNSEETKGLVNLSKKDAEKAKNALHSGSLISGNSSSFMPSCKPPVSESSKGVFSWLSNSLGQSQ